MTDIKRPLVAILDGKDASIESSTLKDVAAITICNVQDPTQIPKRVLSEAVAVFQYHIINLTRSDLQKFKCLIVRMGAGVDNVDLKAAAELGIAVCNVPAYGVEEVADHAMSFILNMYRKTYHFAKALSEGQSFPGPDDVVQASVGVKRLRGETLGIIGLGRIGTAVALRAKGFGFNILFYDPFIPDGVEKSLGIQRASDLQELLNKSDCVTLHCDLNEGSRHIINEMTLKQVKPGAFIVNTARGGLIDEVALAKALKSGRVAAVGLDVHENEPKSVFEGPLKGLNVICTPHSAFYSETSGVELRKMAAEEVKRGLTGKIPDCLRNCVNKNYLVNSGIKSKL